MSLSTGGDTVRIGCGSGYASDRVAPAVDLAASGAVDVLSFDCLAERTLALAQLRRRENPATGYDERLPEIVNRLAEHVAGGLTIVGNFGAANVAGAVEVTLAGLSEKGIRGIKIAAIEGDDVLDAVRALDPTIEELGCSVSDLGDRVISANGYLGAEPVVEALRAGADWVIGGRIGDASLFVGPICAALDWDLGDWNRVASATLVGHILECSTQATGGYFADPPYRVVPKLDQLGFPYAIVSDGEAVITKLDGTGGLVSEHTVAAQVAYEVHDPTAYLTADVTANFAAVECVELEPDRVRVTGATGVPSTGLVKVLIGVDRGYRAVAEISYAAAGCVDRAKQAAEVVAHHIQYLLPEIDEIRYDLIGVNSLVGNESGAARTTEPGEVRLRVAARVHSRAVAEALAREVERLLLHGPAGGGGASRSITPAVSVFGILVPSELVNPRVTVIEAGA
jgi:hypothetical protein